MILAEFLSFKKFDIEEDIINNPTSFTVDSLTQAISDSINLLKPIRPSSQRTAKVIKSIMEKHMKKLEIGWYYDELNNRVPDTWVYERTIESDILKLWLYRFSEQNLSYNNTYNALVPYLNTGNAFPINLRQIEDAELIQQIANDEAEEQKANSTKKTEELLIEIDDKIKYSVETSHGPVEGNSKELVDILAKAISEMPKIELYDYSLKDEEIDKYITNKGLAKFYDDILSFEVDKLILSLEGFKILDLFMIIDSICTLIKENHNRITFVTNKIKELFKELKSKELDNLLILEGVKEWFSECELEDSDLGARQIFNFVHRLQVSNLAGYFLFGYNKPELKPFNNYLHNTWMGKFMIENAEIVANEKSNSNNVNLKNDFVENSETLTEKTINSEDASVKKQLAQEFAAITRPLSTSFPSFRTYAALKLKKQPAQLKKALLDDFNEFNLMIDLVPNNESERQNMIDQLDSFSIQYPDWNFDIEESKKIVMDLNDGRRDEIIYNTICNLNDLKSNHDYRNLIFDLDKYINSIQLKNNKSNGTIKANINSTSNKIEPLKYNKLTLPEVIFNHFWSFGTFYESTKQVFPPFSNEDEYLDNDIYYSYFYDVKDLEFFKNLMVNSELWTKPKYPQITTFDLMPVIMPYAKGFTKGYSDFTNGIKKPTELFNLTDTDIAYKVFERVYVDKEKETERFYLLDWIISNKTKSGLATNIDSNTLFRLGVYNGEFFKAWELILANPMKFEQFFKSKEPINGQVIDSIKVNEEKTEQSNADETDDSIKIVDHTIDISKYDPEKIFNQCISKKVFKCEKDIFNAWLVNGNGSLTGKIKWLFQGGNKAQLRAFMNKITGENVKPAQINKIFEVAKVNSNDNPGKLSSDLEQILILSPIKKVK